MTGWVILVDQPKDLPNADTPHKVITTSDYLARPRLFDMGRPKLVNLSRSYAYQSKGYYASLLAEARGHRVVPTVETMLELREAKLYEHALPELEDELNRCARRADFQPEGEFKLLVCFGIARDDALRVVRPAAVRLVPLPGARSHRRARHLAVDRAHPAAQHHPARQRRRRASSARRCTSHTKREWRDPKAAHGREIRPRRALRSEREDAAVLAGLDQALGAHRREAVGRRRADHPPRPRRARRIRRAVHPRDHLDRQPHLPLRAPRLAGGHAGHRRPDLDDPLHQQGLPDGAARLRTRCRRRRP